MTKSRFFAVDILFSDKLLGMNNAIEAQRFPLWKRPCEAISDEMFTRHGLLRCISSVHSGRHYLQVTDEVYEVAICHSSYFNALKSPRRMNRMVAIEKQSYKIQSEILSSRGFDYLKQFPELDGYRVEAADGHFTQNACHTKINSKGQVPSAGNIYSLNLRNGLLRALCTVTNGTIRHHEVPVFRKFVEQRQGKKETWQKRLYVYDKAVTDYSWWDKQKKNQNFMITVLKENAVATFIELKPSNKMGLHQQRCETWQLDVNSLSIHKCVYYKFPLT